ncbi:hypothetical protein [uncultured Rhodospira sp.]|uniref:hypothetical protein n=1 Tax=uncultured Rhodospira sp. TaxID=1936189 RepID=UPI002634D25D|nr:hypothetical protein [uncultured Rhodospira sp.]
MTSRRRIPRCGRHLPPHDAPSLLGLISEAADLHQVLVADGYALDPRVRPYRRQDGRVSIRFVWRRRDPSGANLSVTATHVLRVEGRAEP